MGTELLNVILKSIMSNNKEHASAALSQHLENRSKSILNPVKEDEIKTHE